MTSRELKIYKHLPDRSKMEFIVDFWERRDPTPGTKVNEALGRFLYRVAYANKVFTEACMPGWNTDRGRLLIQLGFPDDVYRWRHNIGSSIEEIEMWTYYRTQLVVRFIKRKDGFRYKMQFNRNLLTAIEYARRHSMIYRAEKLQKQLTFKAKWKWNKLTVRIPVDRVVYDELNSEYVGARFVFRIDIYSKKKKLWTVSGTITNMAKKKETVDTKFVQVDIDLLSKIKLEKGKYYGIMIVKDLNAGNVFASSYKDVIRIKVK
jgi:GWxTD domain-containing protein